MKNLPTYLIILFGILLNVKSHACVQEFKDPNTEYDAFSIETFGDNLRKVQRFFYQNPDSVRYYLDTIEQNIGKDCKLENMLFLHYKTAFMTIFKTKDDITEIDSLIHSGLKLAENIDYTYYIYRYYIHLTNLYIEDIVLANTYYEKAYELFKGFDTDTEMLKMSLKLMHVNAVHGNLKLAREYGTEARSLLSSIYPNTNSTMDHVRYHYVATDCSETKEEAFSHIDSAMTIADSVNNPFLLQQVIFLKGTVHQRYHEYTNAIKALDKADEMAKKLNRPDLLIVSSKQKAYLYASLENYKEAKTYFETYKNSGHYESVSHYIQENNFHKLGSEIYSGVGDYKEAFSYLELYIQDLEKKHEQKRDSIRLEFTNKYNIEQTKNKLEINRITLKQERAERRYIIGISLSLLIIITLIYLWRSHNNKRKLEVTRKILEDVNHVNAFKKRFLEHISQEIRTPLSLINGSFETIQQQDVDNTYSDILNIGHQNSKQLNIEIENILNLMRAESFIGSIELETVYLLNVFDIILENYKINIFSKGLSLTVKHNLNAHTVARIDSDKITTILINFLNNAIKHSKEGGLIQICIEVENGQLAFNVTDYGEKVSEEDIPYIFNRYNEHTNAPNISKYRIELSIVQEIANILNGDVSVKTNKAKRSTIFSYQQSCFTDNLSAEYTLSEYLPQKTEYIQPDFINEKPNVLVVDDNELMVEFYKQIFAEHYTCEYAYSGEEALNKIHNRQYDCMVTDIIMPDMDGFELVNELIKNKILKETPVIFVTADTIEEHRIKAFKIGGHDYITKPFIVQELIARINNLIKNKANNKPESLQDGILNTIKADVTNTDFKTDDDLLKKIIDVINENISNVNFKVADLATAVFYSERQLSRKVNTLTGLSPSKFILEIRLLKAYAILKESKSIRILDVQNSIGIKSSAYFNKAFKERFGVTPSALQKNT